MSTVYRFLPLKRGLQAVLDSPTHLVSPLLLLVVLRMRFVGMAQGDRLAPTPACVCILLAKRKKECILWSENWKSICPKVSVL